MFLDPKFQTIKQKNQCQTWKTHLLSRGSATPLEGGRVEGGGGRERARTKWTRFRKEGPGRS